MIPGSYTLAVEHEGFKKYEKQHLMLTASERLAVGEIRLEVGGVGESITVTATGAAVQTASSERSGMVTNSQMANLSVINRNFMYLVTLQPGVVAQDESSQTIGGVTFNALGGRITDSNISVDGVPSNGTNGGQVNILTSMDAIATVKIMVSNFQAEFGRKAGATVTAVTKSGTRDFHGGAYWYKRHEQFNANDFFNNRNGLAKSMYRYTTAGFNVGGPIYIPGRFNRERNKLFFFFSEEVWRETRPQAIQQITMPTEMERRGDFSATRDLNGALIPVYDPANGRSPFPGNIVPASRINSNGQNYLKLFPLPNFFDTAVSAGRYNYQIQESIKVPKHLEMLKIDYPVSSKTSIYGTYNQTHDSQEGFRVSAGNGQWGWLPSKYIDPSQSSVISLTHIFSPTIILETSAGLTRWSEAGPPRNQVDLDRVTKAASGVNIPQFHPEINPYNLVPASTFGGITNGPSVSYSDRFPIRGVENVWIWSANATKIAGAHTLKAGISVERWLAMKGQAATFAGRFDFSRDTNNPYDANYAYANALLGNFSSYTESSARPSAYERVGSAEWFVQDTWKIGRRLTLDYGVRFGWTQPFHSPQRNEAGFVPSLWDASKRIALMQPALVNGARVARNPLTGETYPATLIGAIVPGSGNPYNGIAQTAQDAGYPQGLRNNSGVKAAPRFGFSYDPLGRGRTAIRGGFGMYHQYHEMDNYAMNTYNNPPLQLNPIIYYGNLATFYNQSSYLFSSNTTGFERNRPLTSVMSFSLGIQQDIGFGTVVDVSYVGAQDRHVVMRRNLNSIPLGANFQAANGDPTTPGKALPPAFLRPYIGFNDITYWDYSGNANYNSLQVTADRRFARGLQFGAAWTWSKSMDYQDWEIGSISTLVDPRVWNYGKSGFDHTHVLKLNWMWDIPKASRAWNHAFVRKVLDDWQLSGIGSFISGVPVGISATYSYAADITGSTTDSARVVVLSNPVLSRGDRSFSRNFDTKAIAAPAVGTWGNAPKDVVRGPGINNWDMSLFKNIALPGERIKLQFRGEFYNAFNHTQFSAFDTTARFDQKGNQLNTRLGEFTASRQPRRIQFALRLSF